MVSLATVIETWAADELDAQSIMCIDESVHVWMVDPQDKPYHIIIKEGDRPERIIIQISELSFVQVISLHDDAFDRLKFIVGLIDAKGLYEASPHFNRFSPDPSWLELYEQGHPTSTYS